MPRKKYGRPSRPMIDRAITALDETVKSPDAPTHAKVNAARTLVNMTEKADEVGGDCDPFGRSADGVVLVLPDNGRDPQIAAENIARWKAGDVGSVCLYRNPAERAEIEAMLDEAPALPPPADAEAAS